MGKRWFWYVVLGAVSIAFAVSLYSTFNAQRSEDMEQKAAVPSNPYVAD